MTIWTETLKNVTASNIINYDETNLTDDQGKDCVLVRRGVKHATRIIDFSKASTSVMFAVTADGVVLPPCVGYKPKNLYPEWIVGGPDGTRYNRSKSGWFDSEIYEYWFFKIAFPYLKKLLGKNVLLLTILPAIYLSIIKKCDENQIEYVFLPPHSTHMCQLLYVSYFCPLKIAWCKVLADWKKHHKVAIPEAEFPVLL